MNNLHNPEPPEAYAERIRREQAADSEPTWCPTCGNTGIIPLDDGSAAPCPCVLNRRIAELEAGQKILSELVKELRWIGDGLRTRLATAKADALREAADKLDASEFYLDYGVNPGPVAAELRRMADEKQSKLERTKDAPESQQVG